MRNQKGSPAVYVEHREFAFEIILGKITGDAKALYEAGIAASSESEGVFDQTAFDNYITSTDVDLAGCNELEKIGFQRWLAFYPNVAQGCA